MGGLLMVWITAWLVLLPAALILLREPRRGHSPTRPTSGHWNLPRGPAPGARNPHGP